MIDNFCSGRSFRSRTPIPEMSDDEGLKDNEIQVEADIEDKSIDTISKGKHKLPETLCRMNRM